MNEFNEEISGQEWDDIDFSDLTDEGEEIGTEETGAEETEVSDGETTPTEETEEKGADEAETETKADGDHTIRLKHLDEVKEVSEEEAVALAQKGLDYDRIRQKHDELDAETQKLNGELSQLKEQLGVFTEMAAGNNMTLDQLIDEFMAQQLMASGGITDKAFALEKVRFEREKKKFEAAKPTQSTGSDNSKRDDDIKAFEEAYPEVFARIATDKEAIPQSVWGDVSKGMSLVNAYARYETQKLKEELEAAKAEAERVKQKTKNTTRSTGSQSTTGAGEEKDLIDRLWDEEF